MRRYAIVIALLVSTLVSPVAVMSPASAVCSQPWFKIKDAVVSRKLTNLRSDYLQGPGTINYSTTKSASTDASMSASVTAEAGVIFAKASTTVGVSVGKSWAKSGTWSYTKPVPRGKVARLVMWHETRKFTVEKWRSDAECNSVRIYSSRVNAPVMRNENVWRLQYR